MGRAEEEEEVERFSREEVREPVVEPLPEEEEEAAVAEAAGTSLPWE